MDKPRVKPLEWEEDPRAGWKRGRIVGLSPLAKTEATIFRVEGGWQYMGDVYLTAHDNLEAALDRAKAAAQADYEARRLAAHCPQTDAPCTEGCELGKTCGLLLSQDDLRGALAKLNRAAYAAIRAGKDTTAYPMLNREKLRQIAKMTDELVEQPNVE